MSLSRFAIVAGGIFLLAVTAHAQDADGVYHLTLKDHHFVPDNLTVPANSKVTIHLKNEDDTAEEFDSHDLKREKVVAAGKEITILVGPLDAGSYKFIGEHHEETAKGVLIVK